MHPHADLADGTKVARDVCLTILIPAPTAQATRRCHRAGVTITCTDLCDGTEVVRHAISVIPAGTPAAQVACRRNRASVVITRTNLAHRAEVARDGGLAKLIAAPAAQVARRRNRAGMPISRAHLTCCAEVARHVVIVSPTTHTTQRRDSAGDVLTYTHLDIPICTHLAGGTEIARDDHLSVVVPAVQGAHRCDGTDGIISSTHLVYCPRSRYPATRPPAAKRS